MWRDAPLEGSLPTGSKTREISWRYCVRRPVGWFKVSLLGATLPSCQDMTSQVQLWTTLSSNEDDGAREKKGNLSFPSRSWQRLNLCWIYYGISPGRKNGYGRLVHDICATIWHTFQIIVFARITQMMTTHISHAKITHTRYSTKSMTRVKESLLIYGTHYGQDPKWIPTV